MKNYVIRWKEQGQQGKLNIFKCKADNVNEALNKLANEDDNWQIGTAWIWVLIVDEDNRQLMQVYGRLSDLLKAKVSDSKIKDELMLLSKTRHTSMRFSDFCKFDFPFVCKASITVDKMVFNKHGDVVGRKEIKIEHPGKVIGYYKNGRVYTDTEIVVKKEMLDGDGSPYNFSFEYINSEDNTKYKQAIYPGDIINLQKYMKLLTKADFDSSWLHEYYDLTDTKHQHDSVAMKDADSEVDNIRKLSASEFRKWVNEHIVSFVPGNRHFDIFKLDNGKYMANPMVNNEQFSTVDEAYAFYKQKGLADSMPTKDATDAITAIKAIKTMKFMRDSKIKDDPVIEPTESFIPNFAVAPDEVKRLVLLALNGKNQQTDNAARHAIKLLLDDAESDATYNKDYKDRYTASSLKKIIDGYLSVYNLIDSFDSVSGNQLKSYISKMKSNWNLK